MVILPLVVTFIILKFLFDAFDPIIKDLIEEFAPRYAFPGMGIAGLALIIYLVGLITTHILGRRLIAFGHGIVDLVPVVRGIYRTARQATHVLSTVADGSQGKYSAVVFIEFPGYGLRSIGLVTAKMKDENGDTLLAVYCPTSPFPTSGFLCIIPEDRVTYTDLPVGRRDEADSISGNCVTRQHQDGPSDLWGNPLDGRQRPYAGKSGLCSTHQRGDGGWTPTSLPKKTQNRSTRQLVPVLLPLGKPSQNRFCAVELQKVCFQLFPRLDV